MQERNNDLEREVERFHQRREIEQRVSSLGSSSFLFSPLLFTIYYIYILVLTDRRHRAPHPNTRDEGVESSLLRDEGETARLARGRHRPERQERTCSCAIGVCL